MSGAVPLGRAVALGLRTAVASRSVLAASTAWLVVLAAVHAADAGPPLAAMAVTAAALLPVSAWAAAAQLAATSPDLRALLTAADGRTRVLLADAAAPALWTAAAAAAGVLAPVLADPHRAGADAYLLGALLHLLCGAVGGALALALHAAGLSRGVQALVVAAATLASARLPVLPPAGPVLRVWGTDRPAGPGLLGWALAGPVVLAVVLLLVTARVRRRRC